MRAKCAVGRGVWGHTPLGNVDVLRSILLLFGTLFYSRHGAIADMELGCSSGKESTIGTQSDTQTFYNES